MLRKLVFAVPLCLIAYISHAEQEYDGSKYDGYEPIEIDPEPNWSTVAYSCPLSIKTTKGEHKFSHYSVYDVITTNWALLKPLPATHILYSFGKGDNYNIYLVCEYKNSDIEVIIYAKDAVACGAASKPSQAVCWKSNPYANKKEK
ncbi:MAG: hypothetical protein LBU76_05015 [Azoarcus sp.]|jgi:hypothetical protein|nr:hypothetical protein [Azoarcus sp.]